MHGPACLLVWLACLLVWFTRLPARLIVPTERAMCADTA
jgi:hypothetical protein